MANKNDAWKAAVRPVQMVIDSPAQWVDFLAYLKETGWKWRMYSALSLLTGDMQYSIFVYWGGD